MHYSNHYYYYTNGIELIKDTYNFIRYSSPASQPRFHGTEHLLFVLLSQCADLS